MRARALGAGVTAGLVHGLADWGASGVARVPAVLFGVALLAGIAGGCLAGTVALALRRPRLAPALALAGVLALEGLSIASRDFGGGARIAAGAIVVLAAFAALFVARAERPATTLVAIALVPCGASLGARLGGEAWALAAALLLPLAWLAPAFPARARVVARGAVAAVAAAALVLAQLGQREIARRPLAPSAGDAGARPNVVLLVIDTLRGDALDPEGSVVEFARGGVEFRRCTSAAPWTLPSVGALLTGLYPSEHGAVTAATALPEELTTLAEHLHAAGYATAAFTGGAFVGPAHRLDQGFEEFDARCERGFALPGPHEPLAWRVARNRWRPLRWVVRLADEHRGLAGVLDAALSWIAREPRGPKLVLLHTYQVHDYYLYDPDTDDGLGDAGPTRTGRFAGRLAVHPRELRDASAEELARFRAVYDARVAAVERLFPRLVSELEAALGGETLWVVTADHGEGFDVEKKRVHHGGRLQEDLLHVPLVLRGPGLPIGRAVDAPVRTVDVLPTLLDLLELPPAEGVSGESLLPALAGSRPFPPVAFAEERAHGHTLLSARAGDAKAIRARAGTRHFDLTRDPEETVPLTAPLPRDLAEALDGFAERHPARVRTEMELDAATRAHLRSLGYVE